MRNETQIDIFDPPAEGKGFTPLFAPYSSHLVTWYDIVAFIAFFIRGVKSIKSCTLVYMWSWGLISCLHGGA